MNERPFDFEKHSPPALSEKSLRQELERRRLARQIRVLRISWLLTAICFVLFAFFIAPESLLLAIVSIAWLCVCVTGHIVISVFFYRSGYNEEP